MPLATRGQAQAVGEANRSLAPTQRHDGGGGCFRRERTRSALAARKAHGARLGNRSNAAEAAALGRAIDECATLESPIFNVAPVIDLFSRRVAGWSMSDSMTAQLVTDALVMAV